MEGSALRLVVATMTALLLIGTAGCSNGGGPPEQGQGNPAESETRTRETQEEDSQPPEIAGEGYEVVRVRSLEEANPDFHEGPIEDSGIPASDVDIILEDEMALQAAYNDSTTQLKDYDLISLNFWAGEVDGEIIDEMFFFRTPEAQEAYQQEAIGNLQELTEEN